MHNSNKLKSNFPSASNIKHRMGDSIQGKDSEFYHVKGIRVSAFVVTHESSPFSLPHSLYAMRHRTGAACAVCYFHTNLSALMSETCLDITTHWT